MNPKRFTIFVTVWIGLLSVSVLCNSACSADSTSCPVLHLFRLRRDAAVLMESADSLYVGVLEHPTMLPSIQALSSYPTLTSTHRSSLFRELGHDVGGIARDPVFYFLIAGLMTTPSLLPHEDPEINEEWSGSGSADHIFELGNTIGNGILPITASGIALAYGKLVHRPGSSDFGSDLLRAQIVNGVLTLALKRITDRQRPDGTPWSFPSGHTSSAFASVAVVYRHYGWKLGVPALAIASYVGMSRLQENKHFLSDVIAGAILGGYIGLKVSDRHDSPTVSLSPTFSGMSGISASIRF